MLEASGIVQALSSVIDQTLNEIHHIEIAGCDAAHLYDRLDGLKDAMAGQPVIDRNDCRSRLKLVLDALDVIEAHGRGKIAALATRGRRGVIAALSVI